MDNIIIKDKKLVESKLQILKKEPHMLHVIADFDQTLTKAYNLDKENLSSYGMMRKSKLMPDVYREEAKMLFDKYFPIEMDPTIPLEKKNVLLKDWWQEHLQLFVKYGVTSELMHKIFDEHRFVFRDKIPDFLSMLKENKIPLVILSAGLGDLIIMGLKAEELLSSNVHVISNYLRFRNRKVVSYDSDVVHSMNKNEGHIRNSQFYKEVADRKNVILLGDIIEDLCMAEGLDHNCVLKIGFLNDDSVEKRKIYSEKFDVVITNDGSMEYINGILKEILTK